MVDLALVAAVAGGAAGALAELIASFGNRACHLKSNVSCTAGAAAFDGIMPWEEEKAAADVKAMG